MALKIILLTCFFSYCYGIQLPFLNVNLDFPKAPFLPSFPGLPNPLFQQNEEFPEENSIFGDLNAIPENTFSNKDVKVKKETKLKDGYEITTVNKTGPNFFSFMSEIHNKGNKTNGSNFDLSSFLKTGNFLGGILNEQNKMKKCKPKCAPSQFCDPLFGKCREKLQVGSNCMLMNQCEDGLRCVWGKCNEAEKGDPGTFCKSKCEGDACCAKQEGAFHSICIPKLDEGGVCGRTEEDLFERALSPKKNDLSEKCNPCKSHLKCANVGNPSEKRCVRKSYVEETPTKTNDDDEPSEESSDGDDDNGSSENDESLNDKNKGIPIKTSPKKKSKKKKTTGKHQRFF